MSVSVTKFS